MRQIRVAFFSYITHLTYQMRQIFITVNVIDAKYLYNTMNLNKKTEVYSHHIHFSFNKYSGSPLLFHSKRYFEISWVERSINFSFPPGKLISQNRNISSWSYVLQCCDNVTLFRVCFHHDDENDTFECHFVFHQSFSISWNRNCMTVWLFASLNNIPTNIMPQLKHIDKIHFDAIS